MLLKNDGALLPFTTSQSSSDDASKNCIAVFGDDVIISGGGSGHVVPKYSVTIAEGLANYLANAVPDASSRMSVKR